jgi:hypothetical protein
MSWAHVKTSLMKMICSHDGQAKVKSHVHCLSGVEALHW